MSTEQLEFRTDTTGHRYVALLAGQEVGHSEVDPTEYMEHVRPSYRSVLAG